uniref:N-acetyltransferase domain-containing protein n=1 Tax=Romanomermis culicivorax TaxID=13658 RepID=A0A915J842_ROMCU
MAAKVILSFKLLSKKCYNMFDIPNFLTNNFAKHEITCQLANLSRQEQELFSQLVVQKYVNLDTNYSIGCFDNENNLVGCCLNSPYDPKVSMWNVAGTNNNVAKVLSFFNDGFAKLSNTIPEENSVFDIGYLAIREDYKGKGIAKLLISLSENVAFRSNFEFCIGLATAEATRNIFKKRDYKLLGQQFHKDCRNSEGVQMFKEAKCVDFGSTFIKRRCYWKNKCHKIIL